MTLNEFQETTSSYAGDVGLRLGDRDVDALYWSLGLCGEAGEVAEKVKKLVRDSKGVMTPEIRKAIVKELGDTLFYLSEVASSIDVTLEEVAQSNIDKNDERTERGTIHGSGDDR